MAEFEVNKAVAYWLHSAKYDLSVANAMFKTKKYPYALFMGHLALEKYLKALIVKSQKTHAPFSHSLPYLAEKSAIEIPDELYIKLREFMEFHFEARYPDVTKAFYKKCTHTYTNKKLKEMKEVIKWIRSKL